MVGLESCTEDMGLIGGTERLVCLAKMLGLNVMVGKSSFDLRSSVVL